MEILTFWSSLSQDEQKMCTERQEKTDYEMSNLQNWHRCTCSFSLSILQEMWFICNHNLSRDHYNYKEGSYSKPIPK